MNVHVAQFAEGMLRRGFTVAEVERMAELDFVHEFEADAERMTPDNVLLGIEVSHTSLAFDRGRKAALYAACGFRELWVVDTNRLITAVHLEPSRTGYHDVQEFSSDMTIKADAVDVSLRLADFED